MMCKSVAWTAGCTFDTAEEALSAAAATSKNHVLWTSGCTFADVKEAAAAAQAHLERWTNPSGIARHPSGAAAAPCERCAGAGQPARSRLSLTFPRTTSKGPIARNILHTLMEKSRGHRGSSIFAFARQRNRFCYFKRLIGPSYFIKTGHEEDPDAARAMALEACSTCSQI